MITLLTLLLGCSYGANLCNGVFLDEQKMIVFVMDAVEYESTKTYCDRLEEYRLWKQYHIGRYGE